MELASDASFTDFRFGMWSPIEPAEGHVSRAEVDHYRRMVDGALERGLRPLVTMHHFTLPAWFSSTGGWVRSDARDRFLRYVDAIAPVFADGVTHVGIPRLCGCFRSQTLASLLRTFRASAEGPRRASRVAWPKHLTCAASTSVVSHVTAMGKRIEPDWMRELRRRGWVDLRGHH